MKDSLSIWFVVFLLLNVEALKNDDPGVVLYTEPNFLGESQFLGLGGWILSMDLSEDVNPNVIRLPKVSSYRILSGAQAIFFETNEFGGAHTAPITTDCQDLQAIGIEKLTSSVFVERTPGVSLFTDDNFKGKRQFLPVGNFDVSLILYNDEISSFLLSPLTKVIVFENNAFSGEKIESEESIEKITTLNNKISSIQVLEFPGMVLFTEPFFKGDSQTFKFGKYNPYDFLFSNKLGSLKISQGVKATLFLEDYFQGPAVVFSSNWLNFSSINLHKLTTLNVEPLCENKCVHGECVSYNKCKCKEGWKGATCNEVDCPNCINGRCLISHHGPSCICFQGWEGPGCQLPICFPKCQSGTCLKPNVCECKKGFVGKACERLESICGDGFCTKEDENCKNCPQDCGVCPEEKKQELPPPNPIHSQGSRIKLLYDEIQDHIPETLQTQRASLFLLILSMGILGLLAIVNRYLSYSRKKIEQKVKSKSSKKPRTKSD